MSVTRRKMMFLVGGGAILAASGAFGVGATRHPRTAYLPWTRAGEYEDARMWALSWALLAPNPHNRQPWLADLSEPGIVTLFADPDRLLPHTDPYSRQITIGLGCFLELMRMAAAEEGIRTDTALFPEGEDHAQLDHRPVARVVFTADPTVARDPLFAQIPHRRTSKEPYDLTRTVSSDVLAQIAGAARSTQIGVTNDSDRVQWMRDISTRAFEIEFATHRTLKESVELFRIGAREVDANPDGIDFTGPMFESLRMTRLFTREASLDPDSFSTRSALDTITQNMQTGMAHLWQVTPGNTRSEQIVAGEDWVRMNLAATALGVGLQPLSQALQEFPEMAELYAQTHAALAPQGGIVQMWARLGYGPQISASPRWPIETRILNA